jgi:acylphosphatase
LLSLAGFLGWREVRTERLRQNRRVPKPEIVRRRLVVRGRVQGVFFRDSTRERARREGVSGWAYNRPDGGLEIVLEGDPGAVARVASFAETGPRGAKVDSVEARDEPVEGIEGFAIR